MFCVRGMKTIAAVLSFCLLIGLSRGKADQKLAPHDAGEKEILQASGAREKARHLALDEDYPHEEEDANEVSKTSYKGDKYLQGDEQRGNADEDHATDMHHERGTHKEFSQGGGNFNKHHRENVADNKELENVKQHDAGEKFGAEALKEHKLGKHKEKSKGHKLHGFKNTYHKEEYGDHKTFHDEFLDTDHHHNYDDHHEHRQLQGGKFSKGFKHEGKNKNFDEGDERQEWGKDGHDSYDDRQYEGGGHSSKHHHGHKKHEGHQEASSHEGKHSQRKQKKEDAPQYYSQVSHHGPHQAQYGGYDTDHHHANPHSYHEQETYPTHDDGSYEKNHGPYPHEEERAVPLKKMVPMDEPRSVFVKPAVADHLERAPLYKDNARAAPLPHSHTERQKLARDSHFKSPLPQHERQRHYSQPITATQHQFYHRWPEHEKHHFHIQHSNQPQSNHQIQNKHSQLRHHQPHDHNLHSRNHPRHNHHHNHHHLNNHLHSKPYNWQERDTTHSNKLVHEPRFQEPSRFDADKSRMPDQYNRAYVQQPSELHYRYNYHN